MPAHVQFGSVKDKVPLDWTSIDIKSLTCRADLSSRYIQLKIQHCYPHYVSSINRLKMLLTDDQGLVIDFFSMGQVADDLKICEKGDSLLCLDFEVESCPGQSQRPCQIIADDTGQQKSLIWVSKPIGSAAPSSPNPGEQQVPVRSESEKKQRRVHSYSYKPLSEIKVNTVVDVYGVVKFVKPPVKGRGSDYYCVVGLMDPSLVDRGEEKLTCVFFNRELEKLPQVEEGDVIRLHRLKIQIYQGGKQGFNGPGFQWLIFHGSVDSCTPSTSNYTFEDQDKVKVTELFDWWSKECEKEANLLKVVASPRRSVLSLSDVKPKRYFDMVCQAVQVCVLDPDVCRLVRVWDGTKFEGPLKRVTEGELNMTLKGDEMLIKASQDLTVDLFFFDNHAQESGNIQPGDVLLLVNVHSSVVSGLVELTLHGGGLDYGRGFQVLSADTHDARVVLDRVEPLVDAATSCPAGGSGLKAGGVSSNSRDASRGAASLIARLDSDSSSNEEEVVDCNDSCRVEDRANLHRSKSTSPLISVIGEGVVTGRKDVPSKNKLLRFRIRSEGAGLRSFLTSGARFPSHEDTTETSRDVDGGQDCRNPEGGEPLDVCQEEGGTLNFEVEEPEDKETRAEEDGSSSSEASQSVLLSVYNDSDFAPAIAREKGTSEGRIAGLRGGQSQKSDSGKSFLSKIEKNDSLIGRRTKAQVFKTLSTTGQPRSMSGLLQGLVSDDDDDNNDDADDDGSSQGSFVTAPSPDLALKGLALLSVPPQNETHGRKDKDTKLKKSRDSEERKNKDLEQRKSKDPEERGGNDSERIKGKDSERQKVKGMEKMKCSDSVTFEENFDHLSKKRHTLDKEHRVDKILKLTLDDGNNSVSVTREEKREFDGGLEMTDTIDENKEEETFSQRHLEILDSSILSFDTEEFSQAALDANKNTDDKTSKVTMVKETQPANYEPILQDENSTVQGRGDPGTSHSLRNSQSQEKLGQDGTFKSFEKQTQDQMSSDRETTCDGSSLRPGAITRQRMQGEVTARDSVQEEQISGQSRQQQAGDGGQQQEQVGASLGAHYQGGHQEVNKLGQGGQHQDSQQEGQVGDSQVSSSTDSVKSQSQQRCMLRTASVVVNHPGVKKSSLQQVMDHPPPHKFRIQARVESVVPRPAVPGDLVHFFCPRCKFFSRMSTFHGGTDETQSSFSGVELPCPKCVQSPSTLRPITLLVLQLSDGRDTISASLWDKNAELFFGGISSKQLLANPESFQQVQSWLSDLCPLGSSLEDRPVLECCVCSYHVDGDVKFQIFDTSLV